jgi:hypothetical protein
MPSPLTISVVVCSYGDSDDLCDAIRSVRRQTQGRST